MYIYKTSYHGLPTLTIHISHKTYCLLGFLRQNLLPDILEYAYKQLALPLIEYCCSIWDPYQKYLIDKFEMSHHRAATYLNHGTDISS